tara:strand:+ start:46717 stop:47883 length:1167 start_codon:yes stop_codon:yes gene_type:complete
MLDATGYTRPTLDEIIESMQATARSEFGPLIDVSSDEALGHFIGVNAIEISGLYEDLQQLYDDRNPNTAQGAALDALYLNLGLKRQDTVRSTAVITITGTPTTVIPAGEEFTVAGDSSRIFALDEETTIPASGSIDANVTATVDGAVAAPAGTLTETTFVGITVTNDTDASLGRGPETDTEFRTRGLSSSGVAGKNTVFAIRSSLAQIDGVTEVAVIENLTDCWLQRNDADPMPPHSIEPVVENGKEADIIQKIVEYRAEGVRSFGNQSVLYTDESGTEHYFGYSRPVEIPVAVIVRYDLYSEEIFPTNGEDTIKAAMIEFADDEYKIGKDVIAQRFFPSVYSVPGIKSAEITISYLGGASSETDVCLPIANFQKATLNILDITVTRD